MAIGNIGTTNISFGSWDTWHNSFSSDSNISLQTAFSNLTPADTAPYQVSTYSGDSILYGSVVNGVGGTIAITGTYTATVAASATHTFNNAVVSDTALVLTATNTYPYTFHSWRTAAGGGGTQLQTGAALTLNASAHTGVQTFHAHYTTTHLNP